eukprot:TRINITY_DN8357_c0_g1_i1.p1 TRINITY_DN8357_c0_g1~~TRINITY_DN8357_c0_g1_i1.p1  ORF type:complete len:323 (+),score=44.99 TRINITY_DN8357_c0_g1_i1:111-1079(+)
MTTPIYTQGGTGYGYGSTAPYQSYSDRASGRPSAPPTAHSILRSGDLKKRIAEHEINMWELIFVPWFLLVLILACFFIAGAHGQVAVLWTMPTVLIGLSSLWLWHHYKLGDTEEVALGALALVSIFIATCVGVYANLTMLQEYHRMSQGASYFNVLPSEAVAGKMDATTLGFTSATKVDIVRGYGYTDATSPTAPTYCVAPISTGEASFTRIQYWAAGINCCPANRFTCGQATNYKAHGGVVLSQDYQADDNFAKAVRAAQDAYGLVGSNGFLLVDWRENPVNYRNGLWSKSGKLFLIVAGVYLVICGMVGYVTMPILRGDK